jgi:hypothetical protein
VTGLKHAADGDEHWWMESSRSVEARWMAVGQSTDPDAWTAGGTAASQALQGRDAATVLLVFSPVTVDLPRMLAGICSVTPDSTLIAGCTTVGEIAPAASPEALPGTDRSVVVVALGGPGFEAATLADPHASAHRRETGAVVAAAVGRLTLPHRTLLLLADGLTREQHEIVRGAYGELGAEVPIVGGCSADDLRYENTYQFHGTGAGVEVLQDAVVGVALGSTSPMGAGIAHGWTKVGDPMLVTSSVGGDVHLLDGEPAATVYWPRIAPAGMTLAQLSALRADDLPAFRELLFRNPLGLSRRSGEDLRVVHDIDVESGTISCLADVPQGALAWAMRTDPDALIEAAAMSCASAVDAVRGAQPLGFLVFDCGVRRIKLGPDGVRAEHEAISKIGGGTPYAGFYTYGEIGRLQGARGMHQLTVVTLAVT